MTKTKVVDNWLLKVKELLDQNGKVVQREKVKK